MKKKRKLLFQIGTVFLILTILMIVIITQAMYKGVENGFLKGKSSQIGGSLEAAYYNIISWCNDPFYFDYWEENPGFLEDGEPVLSGSEDELLNEEIQSQGIWRGEWIREQSEKIQRYCAYAVYTLVATSLSGNYESLKGEGEAPADRKDTGAEPETAKEQDEADRMASYFLSGKTSEDTYDHRFLIDINEPHRGFIYSFSANSGISRELGDSMELDLTEHPGLQKLLEEGKNENTFEKVQNFPAKGSYYIGYRPVIIDGKLRAVIGFTYNWSTFRRAVAVILRNAFLLGIGGILLMEMILLLMLYRRVIVPVARMQQGVSDYTDTKDSRVLDIKMTAVSQNNELGILSRSISEMAKEIDQYTRENVRLAEENARVSSELEMAKSIQASQLPNVFPPFPERKEFSIYASMTPAREVGGDFYDFFFVDQDHLALIMADVSGKGIPAALFMMMSKILLGDYVRMGFSPSETLELTNNAICRHNQEEMFVTVWLGILEISTGKVTASNAGHEYPIVRQPDGSFELLKDRHCFVVGGMEDMKYQSYEFTLSRGSTLFLYTDGVPEATDASEELFGTERLLKILNETKTEEPSELLPAVKACVDGFVGEAPQFDDLTMLGITLY
ncbi:MAG: PP2C family protein-serine/threonine phosphatase [Blautia sp.]|nr:PP2C family protein-serine/threonine phosphatase [Blautia sp.]